MFWLWLMINIALGSSGVCGYKPKDLGPMCIEGHYGLLTPKYNPLTSIDIQASANLAYFLERFRIFFETGFGGVPPLDPYYYAKTKPVHFDDEEIQGNVHFSHLYLTGAKKFIKHLIEVRVGTGRVDLTVEFPTLTMHVDFTADMKADELRNYISGHANITFHNVMVTAVFQAEANTEGNNIQDQKLSISAFEYYIRTTNAQYNLRDANMLQEEIQKPVRYRMRRSVKTAASLLLKEIGLEIADKFSYATVVSLVDVIDEIFSHYNRAQIMAMLVPDTYPILK